MPTLILDNAFVEIDGNDVSSDANQVSLSYESETQDETAFGDDTRINKGGLKNWSGSISFHQDFDAAALDSILFGLVGTQVTIKIRPDGGAVSTSNPEYTGTALITSYPPLGNSVGELAQASIDFVSAGTLSRATS